MARLSEDLHPALSPQVLDVLFKKSICTCPCFVRASPELLVKLTGMSYSQILEIKDGILFRFSSRLKFGHKYYKEIISQCAIIPSGIENLDKLLDSGFVTGNIYELCGFSGCGKTQICMTVAANICTSNNKQQILYIDTKNDISAHRLLEIVESHNVENVGEALQRILVCQVRTACDLLQELHQIQSRLHNSKDKCLGLRLIIIDSLSALFQRFHDQSECLSLLNSVASLLKHISAEYHIAVLLTNYAKSWTVEEAEGEDDEHTFQQIQQPALGKYWAHVPSNRIMVKKLNGSSDCFLILLKSPSQSAGKSVKVRIGDGGVT